MCRGSEDPWGRGGQSEGPLQRGVHLWHGRTGGHHHLLPGHRRVPEWHRQVRTSGQGSRVLPTQARVRAWRAPLRRKTFFFYTQVRTIPEFGFSYLHSLFHFLSSNYAILVQWQVAAYSPSGHHNAVRNRLSWDNFLVQWLRLHIPNAGGPEFNPWAGNLNFACPN